jgi:hypothetical protein
MVLALVAISTVIFGLLVQERAKSLANAASPMVRESGRRSAAFGGLIAVAATPWVAIGIALSRII